MPSSYITTYKFFCYTYPIKSFPTFFKLPHTKHNNNFIYFYCLGSYTQSFWTNFYYPFPFSSYFHLSGYQTWNISYLDYYCLTSLTVSVRTLFRIYYIKLSTPNFWLWKKKFVKIWSFVRKVRNVRSFLCTTSFHYFFIHKTFGTKFTLIFCNNQAFKIHHKGKVGCEKFK